MLQSSKYPRPRTEYVVPSWVIVVSPAFQPLLDNGGRSVHTEIRGVRSLCEHLSFLSLLIHLYSILLDFGEVKQSMSSLALVAGYVYSSRYMLFLLAVTCYGWMEWTSYRRLHQFKGPKVAGFTSLFMAYVMRTKQAHIELYAVSQKYGELAILSQCSIYLITTR